MIPSRVRAATVIQRLALIDAALAGIGGLPLSSADAFAADPRDAAAAESYVRRALEGLLDLGWESLAGVLPMEALPYKTSSG